jgi:hypothetical protein
MATFEQVYDKKVVGRLTAFDRMIFKGHLTGLYPEGSFARLLSRSGVLLKDFGPFVEKVTTEVKEHVRGLATGSGRPCQYLESATTKRSGRSKDDVAREIAERDGITDGLVCVLSTVEPCDSFDVRGDRATHRLRVVRRRRKGLHLYLYLVDHEFGWMHVRLQTWFPFTIQVYVNGREWLGRRLDREGIGYTRYLNSFQSIDDLPRAQAIADSLSRRDLVGVLNHFAALVNPWLPRLRALGFGGYYWSIDQCEGATDLMFASRSDLDRVLPDLLDHVTRQLSPPDVLRFLGRKLHPNLQAEVTTQRARRPEGFRVKHSFKRNSIKLYDKGRVLRVETTINNPGEFKVLRTTGGSPRWLPMGKSVSNLWRFADVVAQANDRYLEALAQAQLHGEAVADLDRLCQPRRFGGRRFARFEPLRRLDLALFLAVLAGESLINGFRNRHLAARLYQKPPADNAEAHARSSKVSRLIAKLRAHRLVAKVKDARLYRVTPRGHRIMTAVVRFYQVHFPLALEALS